MSENLERQFPALQPLHRSVASIATAMFSCLPQGSIPPSSQLHNRHQENIPSDEADVNNVKVEHVEHEGDLFVTQASNDEHVPCSQMSPDDVERDDQEMYSQASEMMSFSQLAQSYNETEGQNEVTASKNNTLTQSSEGTSFTQILEDINHKTAMLEKQTSHNKNNDYMSLFSSASPTPANLSQGSANSQKLPLVQQQNSSLTQTFGFHSHSGPVGGVYRPVPLVPLTPFNTNTQSGNAFSDFSSAGTFSAPSTGGSNHFNNSFQGMERPSDNVPSFARAPPFASNLFQTARGGPALFSSAHQHENEISRSNNLFQSAINEGTSTSSFLPFSQPFGPRQNTHDKENQPRNRDARVSTLFQKAGDYENHSSLRKEDQFSTLANDVEQQNDIDNTSGDFQDNKNLSLSNGHSSIDAKSETKAADLTKCIPKRPVFGKTQRVTPSFKPVFKKPNVKTSSAVNNSVPKVDKPKPNLENTANETGTVREKIFASSKDDKISKKGGRVASTSQVFRPTHTVKNIPSSTSVPAQYKSKSSSPSKIAGGKILQQPYQKKGDERNDAIHNTTFELSRPHTGNKLTDSSSDDFTFSTSTQKEKNSSVVENKLHGNATLKMKKTDLVPKPKIMIKSEKELCNPDYDNFLTEALTSSKKSCTRIEKESKKNCLGQVSKGERGSHLEHFKRKMSSLYKKNHEKCSNLLEDSHSKANATSMKERLLSESSFAVEGLPAINSSSSNLFCKSTSVPQPNKHHASGSSASSIHTIRGIESSTSGSLDDHSNSINKKTTSTTAGGNSLTNPHDSKKDPQRVSNDEHNDMNFKGTSGDSSYMISSSVLAMVGSDEETSREESFSPQAVSSPAPHSQAFAPQPPSVSPVLTSHIPHKSCISIRTSDSPSPIQNVSLPFSSSGYGPDHSKSNAKALEDENDAVANENSQTERLGDQNYEHGYSCARNSDTETNAEESSSSNAPTNEGIGAALSAKLKNAALKTQADKARSSDSSQKCPKPPRAFNSLKKKTPWLSSREATNKKKSDSSSVFSRATSQHEDINAIKPRTKRPTRDKNSGSQGTEEGRPVQDLKEHMLELQQQTPTLVYVRCDDCNKWRQLQGTEGPQSNPIDPADLPSSWTCSMNPDKEHASCAVPEEELPSADPDHYVVGNFTLGSVVWVRQGSSYYPAMVDDDPDTDTYFWLPIDSTQPNWYHVTYFESPVSRNWVRAEAVSAFTDEDAEAATKSGCSKTRSEAAVLAAATAKRMSIVARRRRFCFAVRYKGPWFTPAGSVTAQSRKRPTKQHLAKKNKKLCNFVFYKNT